MCVPCGRAHVVENDVRLALDALEQLFVALDHPDYAAVRQALGTSRGKMVGVLVGCASDGSLHTLHAYSGELAGRRDWPQFVGPVLRRADTAELEAETLRRIAELEHDMAALDVDGAQRHLDHTRERVRVRAAERRSAYRAARRPVDQRADQVLAQHDDAAEIERARRALLAERAQLSSLRRQRKATSLVLSRAMFDAAGVTNARGVRRPLRAVFAGVGIAGGTTDCTLPKLLEAANVARLRPLAVAEAWWGPPGSDDLRRHGQIAAPCEKKCKPVLGYLLCDEDGAGPSA